MRRGVKWAVVAAATASVVALATWRSGIMARPQQSPGELARAEYDRRSMTPLRRLQRADFVGLLSKGELPAGGTEGIDFPGLLDEAGDFLYYRLAQDDPAVYVAWRSEHGYRFLPFDAFAKENNLDAMHKEALGSPLPADATMESVYPQFWKVGSTLFGDVSKFEAIATDPAGTAVCIGKMPLSSMRNRPRLRGTMGDLWYGDSSATMRSWFQPPTSVKDMADPSSQVTVAEVAVLLEFANGDRRPFVMTYARDSTHQRWVLEFICQYNIPSNGMLSALEY